MPDLAYHEALWCKANTYHQESVEGSRNKTYTVMFDRRNGWTCDCADYRYRKRCCKHIAKVQKTKCDYGWEAAIGEPVADETFKDGKCPKCGSKAIGVRYAI